MRAIFGLALRAEATAEPALTRVEASLSRYEAAEQAAVSLPSESPKFDTLGALTAKALAERRKTDAVGREIDGITARIGALLQARKAHRNSVWHGLFAERVSIEDVATLKRQRFVLIARYDAMQRRMLLAIAAEEKARRERRTANALLAIERKKVVEASRKRSSIVDRARTLLRAWPALAHLGIQRLLAMALRIEKARDQGWDPGGGYSA